MSKVLAWATRDMGSLRTRIEKRVEEKKIRI